MSNIENVGFDVLTAVAMKSSIVWYVTPCSLVKVHQRSDHVTSIFRFEG
jgi:hypothetical protein